MVKNLLKKLFFVFGFLMFLVGIRGNHFYNVDYVPVFVVGVILITLGWKYPSE
ncbi:MAG: hypothetical protein KKA79_09070 [Nanoarchaeota archaeon]|nr:hypothetical protein [Nanoarchaeota archaeon]